MGIRKTVMNFKSTRGSDDKKTLHPFSSSSQSDDGSFTEQYLVLTISNKEQREPDLPRSVNNEVMKEVKVEVDRYALMASNLDHL